MKSLITRYPRLGDEGKISIQCGIIKTPSNAPIGEVEKRWYDGSRVILTTPAPKEAYE